MRSQKQIVLDMLKRNGSLCVADLPVDISYTLRNRVSELRREGKPIESSRCTVHQHRASVSRYRLAQPQQQEIALT